MVDLHVHTCYSLLDSMIKPKELIEKIKEQGKTALCITDHGHLYGNVEIYQLCKKNDIKYLHGCEIYVCNDVNDKNKNNKYYHLVLIAINELGRQNLNKIVSEGNTSKYYSKPRVAFNRLKIYSEGILACSACMAGELDKTILNNGYEEAKFVIERYKYAFGGRYFVELQAHTDEVQIYLNEQLIKLAEETNTPYIITTDAHYLNKEDQKYHSLFIQINQDREVGETYTDCYIQSEEEIYEKCSYLPKEKIEKALKNTDKIAELCNVELPLSAPIMPVEKVPTPYKTQIEYLWALCKQGWKDRGIDKKSPEKQKEYKDRLQYEMNAIEKMGFEGYYLFVWGYANSVKRRGIARGSGGGSLVAYLIKIVDIDPIRHGLYFERFIDVSALPLLEQGKITKKELKIPDFDLDFGPEDREKVVQYVVNRYGRDSVACLGSYQYMKAKGAIKDLGRVLGIPFEITNEMTKNLGDSTIEQALDLGLLDKYKNEYPELFDYAKRLAGLPKSFSAHPCFPKGTLVKTDKGYKDISVVEVGDKVLTHTGQYKLVVNTMSRETSELYQIKIKGSLPIWCTPNHPFYVKKRLLNHCKHITYSEPQWVSADNLSKLDKVFYPINNLEILPHYKNLPTDSQDFWWIVGRYIGDGWCVYHEQPRNTKELIICCNKNNNELQEITSVLDRLFDYRYVEENTTFKIFIKNIELFEYLQQFGKYTNGKKITNDVLNLPNNLLECFLQGYISADGYLDPRQNLYYCKTTSQQLALGLTQCVAKLYHNACGLTIVPSGTDIIEGRMVKSKEKYVVFFARHNIKGHKFHYDAELNGLWVQINDIQEPIEHIYKTVYNLSVLDDNSYTVSNIAVHNCGKVASVKPTVYYSAVDINDNGDYIIEGDMHTAEDLGLIKADFLGLRTINIIYDTLEMIGKDYEYIAPKNTEFDDKEVWDNFSQGFTEGIFQFESAGMKGTLIDMQCSSLEDLTVANALYRPGSMAFISDYNNRKKGIETFEYLNPDLESILSNTYGIIVFQEQLIEIGRLAGLHNPDELRKATAKKKADLMAKIEPELKNGLKDRGWTQEQVDILWNTILDFAKYSFNKSHACAYAIIAYICMFLKVHHTKEFMCSWINSWIGKNEHLSPCLVEAKRMGVKVYTPIWGRAFSKTVLYEDGIVLGTSSLKFCNGEMAEQLTELYNSKKYNNFIELIKDINQNTTINSRQLDVLIGINFFEEFGQNKYLSSIVELYDELGDIKQIKKAKIAELHDKYGLSEDTIRSHSAKETEKMFKDIDNVGIVNDLITSIPNKSFTVKEQIQFESENIQYVSYTNDKVSDKFWAVVFVKTYKDETKPYLTLHNIKTGEKKNTKIKKGNRFIENPFELYSILKIDSFEKQFKTKQIGGKWVKTDEEEDILENWMVVQK